MTEPIDTGSGAQLADHLFRTEAGKMVAALTRLLGFQNIEQAEDIVQDTLLKALETWKFGTTPVNPQAWLYRVARNKAIDIIRREKLKYKIDHQLSILLKSEYTLSPFVDELFSEHEIKDSQLRMMFACCHPAISPEAQITLILKTLCGLSAKEISNAFLTGEDTINKRLYRTREKIRNERISLDYPGDSELPARMNAVLKALYLLFNEGYNSSQPDVLIREDLCEEAIRLALLLLDSPRSNRSETSALLALMCYQVSRFTARTDSKGLIILLKDQDRGQWNQFLVQKGNEYMRQATTGNWAHELQIEAAIASVHANASSYETTNWELILSLYDRLLAANHNPVVAMNRCVVLAELGRQNEAIEQMLQLTSISNNNYYKTSLGELYLKAGRKQDAKRAFDEALALTTSNAEQELLRRKIAFC